MEITLNLSEQQSQKLAFIQQHSQENIVSLLDKIINQQYEVLHTDIPDFPEKIAQPEQQTSWNTWVAEVKQLSSSSNIPRQDSDYEKHLLEKYRKQGLIL